MHRGALRSFGLPAPDALIGIGVALALAAVPLAGPGTYLLGFLFTIFMYVHLQETFSDVVKTDKTGLSKTAHTRWMISAFANFLPGSTIFRLA